MKLCSKCGQDQRQHNGWCRSCNKKYMKEYRKIHKAKANECLRNWRKTPKGKEAQKKNQNYLLKHRYGISVVDKRLMMFSQLFKCASCEDKLALDRPRDIHTDHCHKNGNVRAILCYRCNMSLGLMEENPEKIRKLADYAEKITTLLSSPPPPTVFDGGGGEDREPPTVTEQHGEL